MQERKPTPQQAEGLFPYGGGGGGGGVKGGRNPQEQVSCAASLSNCSCAALIQGVQTVTIHFRSASISKHWKKKMFGNVKTDKLFRKRPFITY